MKIILVNPPTLYWAKSVNAHGKASYLDLVLKYLGGIENAGHFPVEHIGLLSIKSYCRSKGLEVGYVNGITSFHKSELETYDAVVREINDDSPVLVGFSGPNLVFEENLYIIRLLKKKYPQIKIVLGHDFASLNTSRILSEYDEIDYIIQGDGEHAFYELADKLIHNSADIDKIAGLCFRDKGNNIKKNSPLLIDINTLPFADRDDILRTVFSGFGVSISSSRGCPFRCTFCTTGQTAAQLYSKNTHRIRDIYKVVDEIELLYHQYGARRFVITDDLFLTKHHESQNRAKILAEQILIRKLDITWMIDCRVDSIVDLELFKLLYKSGLKQIFVGVETGSEKQRANYQKKFSTKTDPAQVLNSIEEIGIRVIPGILTFHPETELQELQDTLNLIENLGTTNTYHFVNRVKPYPGTKLYEEYKQKGWLTKEWPVADFKFKDDRLEEFFSDMLYYSSDPKNSFKDSKQYFQKWIDKLK